MRVSQVRSCRVKWPCVLLHPVELEYPEVLKTGMAVIEDAGVIVSDTDEDVIIRDQISESGSDGSEEHMPERETEPRRRGRKRKSEAAELGSFERASDLTVMEPLLNLQTDFEGELCSSSLCALNCDRIFELEQQFEQLAKQASNSSVLSDFSFAFGNEAATALKESFMDQMSLVPKKVVTTGNGYDVVLEKLSEIQADMRHQIQQRTLIDNAILKSMQENVLFEFSKVHKFYLEQFEDMKTKYKTSLRNLAAYHRKSLTAFVSKQCDKCKSLNKQV